MGEKEKGVRLNFTIASKLEIFEPICKIEYQGVLADITWLEFLRRHTTFQTQGFPHQKYSVKSRTGDRHNLLEPIKLLVIKEFKKFRNLFLIHFVENTSRYPGPEYNPTSSRTPITTPNRPSGSGNDGGRRNVDPRSDSNSRHRAPPSPAHTSTSRDTVPIPISSSRRQRPNAGKKQPYSPPHQERTRKPKRPSQPERERTHKSKQTNPPRPQPAAPRENVSASSAGGGRSYPEDELPGASTNGGNAPVFQDDFDFDDTASQASQDSQMEELAADGMRIEYIKDAVTHRMISTVSNTQMLQIREEVRNLHAKGLFFRFSGRAPMAAHFLNVLYCPQPTQF